MAKENGKDKEDPKIEFTEEQQKWVNKLIGDARTKARGKAEKDLADKTAKDKADAEIATLAAEKKWKELAEKYEKRAKELEAFEGQAKAYSALITGMLKDRVKALGEDAKKAIDGLPESLGDLDKLNWLTKNEGLFQAQSNGVGTPRRNVQKRDKIKVKPTEICKYPLRL